MVWAGVTDCEPVAVAAPVTPEIEMPVAPVTFHESVADWPWVIVAGLAEKEEMTGGETVTVPTRIVTDADTTTPAGSVACAVMRWDPWLSCALLNGITTVQILPD